MALKATICKATLQVADMDRPHYGDYNLTVARHPSETDERMMVRLLAYALNASEYLAFAKGPSDTDEPDLGEKDLTGRILHWIEVGQPDDRRLLRASGRADRVSVYAYAHTADVWWKALSGKLERADKVAIWRIPGEASRALAELAERNLSLQFTRQENHIWLGTSAATVEFEPELLHGTAL